MTNDEVVEKLRQLPSFLPVMILPRDIPAHVGEVADVRLAKVGDGTAANVIELIIKRSPRL